MASNNSLKLYDDNSGNSTSTRKELTRTDNAGNTKSGLDVAIIAGASLVPNVDYDYIDIQQTAATIETFVYKTGGSGGTTVLTIVVTYTSAAKTDLDTVEYS